MTDLAATTREGDRLATLRSLRDLLADEIVTCESKRDTAALTLRFADVLEQIDTIERAAPAAEGTALDEFSRRRFERQSAPRKPRAAGGGK